MLQALCVVYAAPAGGTITSVVANNVGTGVQLVVKGDHLAAPGVFSESNGKVRVLEFAAGLKGSYKRTDVNQNGVVAFEPSSTGDSKARVAIELSESMEPIVAENSDGWTVTFANSQKRAATQAGAPRMIKASSAKPMVQTIGSDHVSIDFTNTDIVQILKAISMQSGANIVSSPDVKGALTISLRDVSIDDALRMVTSLAGLAYANVQNTYIVAPVDKLDAIKRQLNGEVFVTPPPVLPAPDVTVTYEVQGSTAADLLDALRDQGKNAGVAGANGGAGTNGGTNPPSQPGVPNQQGSVLPTGEQPTATAQDSFTSLLRGKVIARATPKASTSQQVIVLKGPQADVENVLDILRQLDSSDKNVRAEVYDVKYADPRSLREELVATIQGLRASLMPASVGNPYAFNEGSAFDQAAANGPESVRQKSQVPPATEVNSAGAASDITSGNTPLAETYKDQRGAAVPMKLILRGTPAQISAARAYARTLDVAPRQIAIEVRVAELSKEDALKLGLNWNILDTGGIVTMFGLDESTTGTPNLNVGLRGGHTITGMLDQALDKRHLIARPNLLVLDGRESEVFIGDIVKYIESIQTDAQGRQLVQLNQDKVGVRLPVLARAGADGNITIDVQPAVSTITGFLDVPGGGQVPQISIRTSQSSAVIKSGETLALGGLIREEDRKLTGGVPFLKDLPIVGQLFRHTENSLLKTEIVFFLTAKIVDENDRQNAAVPNDPTIQKP